MQQEMPKSANPDTLPDFNTDQKQEKPQALSTKLLQQLWSCSYEFGKATKLLEALLAFYEMDPEVSRKLHEYHKQLRTPVNAMLTEMVKFYGYGDWPYGNTPASTALSIANVVCGDSKNDDTSQELLRQMGYLAFEIKNWELLPETRAKVEQIRNIVIEPCPF
jgi:hypothetical protein